MGLEASPTCSLLGEVGIGGGARCCLEGPVRRWELPMRMRSLMPIRLLAGHVGWGREPSQRELGTGVRGDIAGLGLGVATRF